MSRTYRRKSGHSNGWIDEGWYTSELVRSEHGYFYIRVPYPKDSKEFKKGYAKYHGDHGSHNCKEPGPSWFRNLFSTRPLRGKARKELHKFMRSVPLVYTVEGKECHFLQVMNECYEPIIDSMGKLPYWT